MIAGMTYYQICWYFLFYSFCGWVIEVVYHAVTVGKVINRGFLNGPVCPVYGFGMLAVLAGCNLAGSSGLITLASSDTELKSLLILFLGSLLFATLVELAAGWLLDTLFHMRWWDYSNRPLNFHGYICLQFSLIWGLSISAVVLLVQPMMERSHSFGIPEKIGWPVLAVSYAVIMADICVTVAAVRGLNQRLEELDRLQKNMRLVSDRLSQSIGERTIKTTQRIEEAQVQAALAKANLEDAVEAKRAEWKDAAEAKRTEWKDAAEAKRAAWKDAAEAKRTEWKDAAEAKRAAWDDAVNAEKEKLAERAEAMQKRREEILKELKSRRLFSPASILKHVPELKHRDYRELLERIKQNTGLDNNKTED